MTTPAPSPAAVDLDRHVPGCECSECWTGWAECWNATVRAWAAEVSDLSPAQVGRS